MSECGRAEHALKDITAAIAKRALNTIKNRSRSSAREQRARAKQQQARAQKERERLKTPPSPKQSATVQRNKLRLCALALI